MIRAVPCVWFAYVFVVVAFFDSCVMVNIGRHTSICTTRIAFFRRAKYIVVDPPRVRFSGLAIIGKYPDTLFAHYLSHYFSLSLCLFCFLQIIMLTAPNALRRLRFKLPFLSLSLFLSVSPGSAQPLLAAFASVQEGQSRL